MTSQHSRSSNDSFWDGLFSSSSTTEAQEDIASEGERSQLETKENDDEVRFHETESHDDVGPPQVPPFASLPMSGDLTRRKENLDHNSYFPWPIQMEQSNDISLNHLLTSSIHSGIHHNSAFSVGEPPPIPRELMLPTVSPSVPVRQIAQEKASPLTLQPASYPRNSNGSAEPQAEMLKFSKETVRPCLPLEFALTRVSPAKVDTQGGQFETIGAMTAAANTQGTVNEQQLYPYHQGLLKIADQPELRVQVGPAATEVRQNIQHTADIELSSSSPNHGQHAEMHLDYPVITAPLSNDILLGRGHHAINHPGNMRLRSIVNNYRAVYVSTPRREEKTAITQSVVEIAKSPFSSEGGQTAARFLQYHKELRGWVEVSDDIARKKVSHLLRDRMAAATMRFPPAKSRRGKGRKKKR